MTDGLIIDNFAGGGGASAGLEGALGRPIDIAINHSAEALAMHRANHPRTRHFQEDIWEVDPKVATEGKPVDLTWFSPDCKHFSRAKGAKPVDRHVRGVAWVVVKWAREVRPRVIMLENVEEFATWGPLDANDMPSKAHRGQTFDAWRGQLEALGYAVEFRSLRACDYGAPTIRKRLFMVARCDGRPIVWPAPTHGEGLVPYRTAAEIIDFSLPCPSIFERKRPLVENTMRRIALGIQRYVIEAADPFIVNLTHGARCESVTEPFKTLTAAHRGEKALVTPFLAGAGGSAYSGKPVGVDRPSNVVLPQDRRALVLAFMARHYGGMVGRDLDVPAPTQTTRGTQNQLVMAHIEVMRNHASGQSVKEPFPVITAGGTHVAEVRAFLTKYYTSGPQAGQGVDEALHTATTRARFGLVEVAGFDYQIYDIGMRMLSPRELFGAQGFADDYVIAPDFNGKPLTKTAQIRLCGNSVCPVIPEALVRANLLEACREEGAA